MAAGIHLSDPLLTITYIKTFNLFNFIAKEGNTIAIVYIGKIDIHRIAPVPEITRLKSPVVLE